MSKGSALLTALAAAVVAFVIGYVAGSSGTKSGGGEALSEEQVKALPTVAKGIESCPAHGANPAKVVIVEWTDFQ
jgi:hypothetical protein